MKKTAMSTRRTDRAKKTLDSLQIPALPAPSTPKPEVKAKEHSFFYPCTYGSFCQQITRSYPQSRSNWVLDAKGDNYTCMGCKKNFSVYDFANQIKDDYLLSYRIHRASLFITL